MLAIVDQRAPEKAIAKLRDFADVHEFCSSHITYGAISGHPDIFIFQYNNYFICAPNTPKECIHFLNRKNVDFKFGTHPVGTTLEQSTYYNCILTASHFFHKQGFTDERILHVIDSQKPVFLPQAYTRCSLFAIDDSTFITSDEGIQKIMKRHKLNCHYFSPENILLPPYKRGFLGGCFGKSDDTIFLMGNCRYLKGGHKLKDLIYQSGCKLVELYDGPLYDGGGIFFIPHFSLTHTRHKE